MGSCHCPATAEQFGPAAARRDLKRYRRRRSENTRKPILAGIRGEPDRFERLLDVEAELFRAAATELADGERPADSYGGRVSFLYVASLCGVLMLIFGVMYLRDRRAGGYEATEIEGDLAAP